MYGTSMENCLLPWTSCVQPLVVVKDWFIGWQGYLSNTDDRQHPLWLLTVPQRSTIFCSWTSVKSLVGLQNGRTGQIQNTDSRMLLTTWFVWKFFVLLSKTNGILSHSSTQNFREDNIDEHVWASSSKETWMRQWCLWINTHCVGKQHCLYRASPCSWLDYCS